jgi:hypothetical protein
MLAFCVLATVVIALPVAYYRVGWTRMEAACGADRPGDPDWKSVEYGWSWSPAGFQCTYDTGRQRTSLWF